MHFGNLLLGLGFLLFVLLPYYGYQGFYVVIALIGIGVGYGCIPAVIWPSIPIVVGKKHTSLAYGIECIIVKLSFVLIPLMCGFIYDEVSYS